MLKIFLNMPMNNLEGFKETKGFSNIRALLNRQLNYSFNNAKKVGKILIRMK